MIKLLLCTTISIYTFIGCFAQNNPLIESGKVKQKAGNYVGAIDDFTSAINQNSAAVGKFLKALTEYNNIPEFERAEKSIDAPSVDIAYADPYFFRGMAYSLSGKNTDALADFSTAININPKLGNAYFQRGKIKWTIGKKDEGCIDLGTAASLKDSAAKEMFDYNFCWKEAIVSASEATLKLRLNNFQEAMDNIQKSIQLCPDSAGYLAIRGRAYLGLGKYDKAMFDFDKAVALNQKCGEAFLGRGIAYYSKNKFQEAFDDLSKAINFDERCAEAYLYRAYSCEGMEKNESALYDYKQVQRLNPASGLAYFKSGILRNNMNDSKGACNDFKRAASLGYSDAQDYAEKCDQAKKSK
ncbi:MAG TPA: tetratricopeptide repeat protein [Bacteroidia bacterium]